MNYESTALRFSKAESCKRSDPITEIMNKEADFTIQPLNIRISFLNL
jgi:hypothetical protein